jgi:hypothetical protein
VTGKHQEPVETRDVRARHLFIAGAGLLAGVVLSGLIVAAVMGALGFRGESRSSPDSLGTPPGTARLQVTPAKDRVRIEERARRLLHGYAWLDKNHTRARIPIDRAMDILAAKGWPDPEGEKP